MGSEEVKLTVYSADNCMACKATVRALKQAGLDFSVIDLATLPPEQIQVFKDQGLLQAPIVQSPTGEQWAGFRPDKIKETKARLADFLKPETVDYGQVKAKAQQAVLGLVEAVKSLNTQDRAQILLEVDKHLKQVSRDAPAKAVKHLK